MKCKTYLLLRFTYYYLSIHLHKYTYFFMNRIINGVCNRYHCTSKGNDVAKKGEEIIYFFATFAQNLYIQYSNTFSNSPNFFFIVSHHNFFNSNANVTISWGGDIDGIVERFSCLTIRSLLPLNRVFYTISSSLYRTLSQRWKNNQCIYIYAFCLSCMLSHTRNWLNGLNLQIKLIYCIYKKLRKWTNIILFNGLLKTVGREF